VSERRKQLEGIVGDDIACAYQVDTRGNLLVSAGLPENPKVDVAEILEKVQDGSSTWAIVG